MERRRSRARKLPAAERRNEIVTAAIRVFARKGCYGGTTREVAAGARVSEPTVYRYFTSKKALYLAAVQAAAERFLAPWRRRLEAREGHTAGLRALVEGTLRPGADGDQVDACRLIHHTLLAPPDPEIDTLVTDGQRRIHALVAQALAEASRNGSLAGDVDVRAEAWRVVAAGFQASLASLLAGDGRADDALRRACAETLYERLPSP